MEPLPSVDDIRRAALTIRGKAYKTPLLESAHLNDRLGCRLLIKPEMLQVTGSFKFRGAYNRISQIPETIRDKGVVAFSSGNHAQGVALAAKMFGIPAWIIMPSDAPQIKVTNTRAYGANVITYDRDIDNREAISEKIQGDRGATLVCPFDDPLIIAGQGTVGLEIAADTRLMDIMPDIVLAPCGGGGLVAGTALALATECPETLVYSVEPENYDDMALSLASGDRVTNAPGGYSICDALRTPSPGKMTFALNKKLLTGGLSVSDEEASMAMLAAFNDLKLVSEPGGAVALAAALYGKIDVAGKTVVVVMSGGNVDPQTFEEVLSVARLR